MYFSYLITKSIGKKRRYVRNLSRELKHKGWKLLQYSVSLFDQISGCEIFQRKRQPLLT